MGAAGAGGAETVAGIETSLDAARTSIPIAFRITMVMKTSPMRQLGVISVTEVTPS